MQGPRSVWHHRAPGFSFPTNEMVVEATLLNCCWSRWHVVMMFNTLGGISLLQCPWWCKSSSFYLLSENTIWNQIWWTSELDEYHFGLLMYFSCLIPSWFPEEFALERRRDILPPSLKSPQKQNSLTSLHLAY